MDKKFEFASAKELALKFGLNEKQVYNALHPDRAPNVQRIRTQDNRVRYLVDQVLTQRLQGLTSSTCSSVDDRFVMIWNDSPDLETVAQKLSMEKKDCSSKASYLRRNGFVLKDMRQTDMWSLENLERINNRANNSNLTPAAPAVPVVTEHRSTDTPVTSQLAALVSDLTTEVRELREENRELRLAVSRLNLRLDRDDSLRLAEAEHEEEIEARRAAKKGSGR